MKKLKIVVVIALGGLVFTACKSKRDPGRIYMPDMYKSRAYEANDENTLKADGINYDPTPVAGTVKRGDLLPYTITNDTNGYKMSAAVTSPIAKLDSVNMMEAQRLYSINCGICHGPNMDAQGPLAGKVGGIANLKASTLLTLSEGTIFHVITYGKGNMGSYASQLDKRQRWMIAQYVKQEQNKSLAGAAVKDTAKAGSTAVTPAPLKPDTAAARTN